MKKTLLIVEDDEYQLKKFTALAETYNCAVLTAEHGIDAMRILEANKDIDIVITDMQMPYADGRFVISEIWLMEERRIDLLVHSSEDTYYPPGQAINLPEYVKRYKSFARFRKKHPDLRQVREFLDEHCKD